MAAYKLANSSGQLVKGTPGKLYGIICLTAGTISLIDSSGTIYPDTALTPGNVVHFGGVGISFSSLTFVGTGTYNVLME